MDEDDDMAGGVDEEAGSRQRSDSLDILGIFDARSDKRPQADRGRSRPGSSALQNKRDGPRTIKRPQAHPKTSQLLTKKAVKSVAEKAEEKRDVGDQEVVVEAVPAKEKRKSIFKRMFRRSETAGAVAVAVAAAA